MQFANPKSLEIKNETKNENSLNEGFRRSFTSRDMNESYLKNGGFDCEVIDSFSQERDPSYQNGAKGTHRCYVID